MMMKTDDVYIYVYPYIKIFQKTIRDMTSFNEDLQRQLSTTEEELGNSVTQMSRMEEEIVLLQSQVVNLKDNLMESDMLRRKLHNQVQELKVGCCGCN